MKEETGRVSVGEINCNCSTLVVSRSQCGPRGGSSQPTPPNVCVHRNGMPKAKSSSSVSEFSPAI